MLRKVISLWLTVTMLFTMAPWTAIAEGSGEQVNEQIVETVEEPAPAAEPTAEKKIEEAPASEEPPVSEEPPAEDETPVDDETPAEDETPVDDETPAEDETPVDDETPAQEKPVVDDDPPTGDETPVQEEEPEQEPAFDLNALLLDKGALREAAIASAALTADVQLQTLEAGTPAQAVIAELTDAPEDVLDGVLTWVLLPGEGSPELTAPEDKAAHDLQISYMYDGVAPAGEYAYELVCATQDGRMGLSAFTLTVAPAADDVKPADETELNLLSETPSAAAEQTKTKTIFNNSREIHCLGEYPIYVDDGSDESVTVGNISPISLDMYDSVSATNATITYADGANPLNALFTVENNELVYKNANKQTGTVTFTVRAENDELYAEKTVTATMKPFDIETNLTKTEDTVAVGDSVDLSAYVQSTASKSQIDGYTAYLLDSQTGATYGLSWNYSINGVYGGGATVLLGEASTHSFVIEVNYDRYTTVQKTITLTAEGELKQTEFVNSGLKQEFEQPLFIEATEEDCENFVVYLEMLPADGIGSFEPETVEIVTTNDAWQNVFTSVSYNGSVELNKLPTEPGSAEFTFTAKGRGMYATLTATVTAVQYGDTPRIALKEGVDTNVVVGQKVNLYDYINLDQTDLREMTITYGNTEDSSVVIYDGCSVVPPLSEANSKTIVFGQAGTCTFTLTPTFGMNMRETVQLTLTATREGDVGALYPSVSSELDGKTVYSMTDTAKARVSGNTYAQTLAMMDEQGNALPITTATITAEDERFQNLFEIVTVEDQCVLRMVAKPDCTATGNATFTLSASATAADGTEYQAVDTFTVHVELLDEQPAFTLNSKEITASRAQYVFLKDEISYTLTGDESSYDGLLFETLDRYGEWQSSLYHDNAGGLCSLFNGVMCVYNMGSIPTRVSVREGYTCCDVQYFTVNVQGNEWDQDFDFELIGPQQNGVDYSAVYVLPDGDTTASDTMTLYVPATDTVDSDSVFARAYMIKGLEYVTVQSVDCYNVVNGPAITYTDSDGNEQKALVKIELDPHAVGEATLRVYMGFSDQYYKESYVDYSFTVEELPDGMRVQIGEEKITELEVTVNEPITWPYVYHKNGNILNAANGAVQYFIADDAQGTQGSYSGVPGSGYTFVEPGEYNVFVKVHMNNLVMNDSLTMRVNKEQLPLEKTDDLSTLWWLNETMVAQHPTMKDDTTVTVLLPNMEDADFEMMQPVSSNTDVVQATVDSYQFINGMWHFRWNVQPKGIGSATLELEVQEQNASNTGGTGKVTYEITVADAENFTDFPTEIRLSGYEWKSSVDVPIEKEFKVSMQTPDGEPVPTGNGYKTRYWMGDCTASSMGVDGNEDDQIVAIIPTSVGTLQLCGELACDNLRITSEIYLNATYPKFYGTITENLDGMTIYSMSEKAKDRVYENEYRTELYLVDTNGEPVPLYEAELTLIDGDPSCINLFELTANAPEDEMDRQYELSMPAKPDCIATGDATFVLTASGYGLDKNLYRDSATFTVHVQALSEQPALVLNTTQITIPAYEDVDLLGELADDYTFTPTDGATFVMEMQDNWGHWSENCGLDPAGGISSLLNGVLHAYNPGSTKIRVGVKQGYTRCDYHYITVVATGDMPEKDFEIELIPPQQSWVNYDNVYIYKSSMFENRYMTSDLTLYVPATAAVDSNDVYVRAYITQGAEYAGVGYVKGSNGALTYKDSNGVAQKALAEIEIRPIAAGDVTLRVYVRLDDKDGVESYTDYTFTVEECSSEQLLQIGYPEITEFTAFKDQETTLPSLYYPNGVLYQAPEGSAAFYRGVEDESGNWEQLYLGAPGESYTFTQSGNFVLDYQYSKDNYTVHDSVFVRVYDGTVEDAFYFEPATTEGPWYYIPQQYGDDYSIRSHMNVAVNGVGGTEWSYDVVDPHGVTGYISDYDANTRHEFEINIQKSGTFTLNVYATYEGEKHTLSHTFTVEDAPADYPRNLACPTDYDPYVDVNEEVVLPTITHADGSKIPEKYLNTWSLWIGSGGKYSTGSTEDGKPTITFETEGRCKVNVQFEWHGLMMQMSIPYAVGTRDQIETVDLNVYTTYSGIRMGAENYAAAWGFVSASNRRHNSIVLLPTERLEWTVEYDEEMATMEEISRYESNGFWNLQLGILKLKKAGTLTGTIYLNVYDDRSGDAVPVYKGQKEFSFEILEEQFVYMEDLWVVGDSPDDHKAANEFAAQAIVDAIWSNFDYDNPEILFNKDLGAFVPQSAGAGYAVFLDENDTLIGQLDYVVAAEELTLEWEQEQTHATMYYSSADSDNMTEFSFLVPTRKSGYNVAVDVKQGAQLVSFDTWNATQTDEIDHEPNGYIRITVPVTLKGTGEVAFDITITPYNEAYQGQSGTGSYSFTVEEMPDDFPASIQFAQTIVQAEQNVAYSVPSLTDGNGDPINEKYAAQYDVSYSRYADVTWADDGSIQSIMFFADQRVTVTATVQYANLVRKTKMAYNVGNQIHTVDLEYFSMMWAATGIPQNQSACVYVGELGYKPMQLATGETVEITVENHTPEIAGFVVDPIVADWYLTNVSLTNILAPGEAKATITVRVPGVYEDSIDISAMVTDDKVITFEEVRMDMNDTLRIPVQIDKIWDVDTYAVTLCNNTAMFTYDGERIVATRPGSGYATVWTTDGPVAVYRLIANGITLSQTQAQIEPGRTYTMDVSYYSNENVPTFHFESSDESVATVNELGVVTGVEEGTATITVKTADGQSRDLAVTVGYGEKSITITPETAEVGTSRSITLEAAVSGYTSDKTTGTWSSADETIATVVGDQATATVTGVRVGATTITYTLEDGNSASCTLSVFDASRTVTLSSDETSVAIGQSGTVTATVTGYEPENAAGEWTTSNAEVATVSGTELENGVSTVTITGVSAGEATITCTLESGETASCTVTVFDDTRFVTLDSNETSVAIGKSGEVTATVTGYEPSLATGTWATSDAEVAIVSGTAFANGISTVTITGVAAGEATITCTLESGETASCTVNVYDDSRTVTLDSTATSVAIGKSGTVTATVTGYEPENAAGEWTTSNAEVATVSGTELENGVSTVTITGVAAGTATITCMLDSGETATCTVTVYDDTRFVTLDSNETRVARGKTGTVTATVTGYEPSLATATWSTDNEAVAIVSGTELENGSSVATITGVALGTTTITCMLDSGETATCTVTVYDGSRTVTLDKEQITLVKGTSGSLTATVSGYEAASAAGKWETSNSQVVNLRSSVLSNGQSEATVIAVGVGEATVTCVLNSGETATCTVNVTQMPYSIKLEQQSLTSYTGEETGIGVTVLDDDGNPMQGMNYTVKSNRISVADAQVTDGGIAITAKDVVGTAIITVTLADSSISTTLSVTVRQKPTSVEANSSSSTLLVGDSSVISYNVLDEKGNVINRKDGTWSSSNTAVATVGSDGAVKAVAEGQATITFTLAEQPISATVQVNVYRAPTAIEITNAEEAPTLYEGSTYTLVAQCRDNEGVIDVTDDLPYRITFSCDSAAMYVDEETGELTAGRPGVATVTARIDLANGKSLSDSVEFKVLRIPAFVELSTTSETLYIGEQLTLSATIKDAEHVAIKDLGGSWRSDSDTAVVDENGTVTALGAGAAYITYTVDGVEDVTAECYISVRNWPTGVTVNNAGDFETMYVGDSGTLSVTVEGDEDEPVRFSTNKDTTVQVDNDGNITALKAGTADITVNAARNASVESTFSVTVKRKPVSAYIALSGNPFGTMGDEITLWANDVANLMGVGVDANGAAMEGLQGVWESTDETVATVEDGVITAVAEGTADVTFTLSEFTDVVAAITVVVKRTPKEIIVDNLQDITNLDVGTITFIDTTVLDEAGELMEDAIRIYASTDTNVLTVDDGGMLVAKAAGTSTVVVLISPLNVATDFLVTVKEKEDGVLVTPLKTTMFVNSTQTLRATSQPSGDVATGTWSVDDESVATVSQNGVVTAVGSGAATITFTSDRDVNKTAQAMIEVYPKPTKVKMDNARRMFVNQTGCTIYVETEVDDESVWLPTELGKFTSSNTKVLTVAADGTLKAKKAGTANVTYTVAGMSAKCKVTVSEAPSAVQMTQKAVSIGVGQTTTIVARAKTGTQYVASSLVDGTWESSDPSVALVDEGGTVIGLRAGTTRIKFTTYNGKGASCAVTVYSTPGSVRFTNLEDWYVFSGGQTHTVKVEVEDVEGNVLKDVRGVWTSSDPSLLQIDQNGKFTVSNTLTQIKPVTVTYTVMGFENVKAECEFPVQPAPKKLEISVGGKVSATCTTHIGAPVLPISEAYYGDTRKKVPLFAVDVTWTTSDSKVATVGYDEDSGEFGVIPGTKAGTANLKLTAYNKVSVTLKVTVQAKPTSITLSKKTLAMGIGENQRLTVTALASKKKLTGVVGEWDTSDPGVVTVDGQGNLQAIGEGKATVTYTTYNGLVAGCEVVVYNAPKDIVFAPDNLDVYVGEKVTLAPTVQDDYGLTIDHTITGKWNLAELSVKGGVTIGQNGLLTATKACTVDVLFTAYNGAVGTCHVTVKIAPVVVRLFADEEATKPIGKTLLLGEDDTATLYYRVYGNKAMTSTLEDVAGGFTSSKPSVVRVDRETGEMIAVGVGSATVSYTTYNNKKASVTVTVQQQPDDIVITPTNLSLSEGATGKLKAAFYAKNSKGALKAIKPVSGTWQSDDESVAIVDENGNITAGTVGEDDESAETTITFMAYNGVYDSVTVSVYRVPDHVKLTLPGITTDGNGAYKLSVKMSARPEPVMTTESGAPAHDTYTLTSSNTGVLAVEKNGVTVTAKKAGRATLTVTTGNGQTDVVDVVVTAAPDKVLLNVPTQATLVLGDEGTAQLQLVPTVNNGAPATFTFTSSKSSVARVDENGLVTARAAGSVKITAKAHNNKSAVVTLTVLRSASSMKVLLGSTTKYADAQKTIGLGDTFTLYTGLQIGAKKYANLDATPEVSDANVLEVSTRGVVRGVGIGTADVTYRVGNASATFTVTVMPIPRAGELRPLSKGMKVSLTDGNWLTFTDGDASEPQPAYSTRTAFSVPSRTEHAESYRCLMVSKGVLTVKNVPNSSVYLKVTVGGMSFTVPVTVVAVPTKLALENESGDVITGRTIAVQRDEAKQYPTYQIVAKANEGTVATFTYTTSNKNLATVNANGVVTFNNKWSAKKATTVKITVKTHNGKSAVVSFKVAP